MPAQVIEIAGPEQAWHYTRRVAAGHIPNIEAENMSNSKRLSLIGAIALLSIACSQQEAPPADSSAAPVVLDQGVAQVAPMPVLQPLSAEQLAEMREDAPASCNIEAVGEAVYKDKPITVARGSVNVSGWFLSENSKKTGAPAVLRIVNADGTSGWDTGITTWSPRPDVLTAMNISEPGDAGFLQAVDLTSFTPGTYLLSVVFSDGGHEYSCDKDRAVIVE